MKKKTVEGTQHEDSWRLPREGHPFCTQVANENKCFSINFNILNAKKSFCKRPIFLLLHNKLLEPQCYFASIKTILSKRVF